MLKKDLEQELNRTKLILDYARQDIDKKDKEIERLKEKVKEWQDISTRINEDNNRLNNIIKEVREYIDNDFNRFDCFGSMAVSMEMNYKREELLEILDKENK